jgi:hypothetical protein
MQLIYSSEGVETPWSIDRVVLDTVVGARSCAVIVLRMNPGGPTQTTRVYCADTAVMTAWHAATSSHRPARPIAPRGILEQRLDDGSTVRFEADSVVTETIGAIRVGVLPTTVTTRDPSGRIVRRLRERFSLGLATATGGVFEQRDTLAADGWRVIRRFELVGIRIP